MKVVVFVRKGQVNKKQDLIGFGDPYVEVKVGDVEKKTSVQKNTLEPVWEEGRLIGFVYSLVLFFVAQIIVFIHYHVVM
jgi:Ca2+-dependent lipid-binding protein